MTLEAGDEAGETTGRRCASFVKVLVLVFFHCFDVFHCFALPACMICCLRVCLLLYAGARGHRGLYNILPTENKRWKY
jgi:hypothetical protein